jgi:hypothetical protein
MKALVLLCSLFASLSSGSKSLGLLLDNYDVSTPPGFSMGKKEITKIDYDINFKSLKQVSEKLMHLSINFFEFTSWVDPRLAYENDNRFEEYLKKSRIDITKERYSIWLPRIDYTEANSQSNSSEVTYIYPNGTVIFYRKIAATYTCNFKFGDIPNDSHVCSSVAFI